MDASSLTAFLAMHRLLPFAVLALLGAAFYLGWPGLRPEPEAEAERAAPLEVEPEAVEPAPTRAPAFDPALDPRADWLAKNSRALELLGAGDLEGAVRLFGECLAAAPDEPVLQRNLAEALIRWALHLHDNERRFVEAIDALARAIELAPGREDIDTLRRMLDRWRREAAVEEGFWTDRSPYFEVVYDAERADLGGGVQVVIDELHAAYGDLRDWFVVDPVMDLGRPKLRVVLYDAAGFEELTGLGHWAGGVYDGVLRLRVDDLSQRRGWRATLRHELTHAFVREVGGRDVPSWLNEGLAQLLDGGGRDEDRLRHARTLLAQRLDDGGELFALDELEGSLATWHDTGEISVGYAQSLVLTARLLASYGEHTVRQLLTAFREGAEFEPAFLRETGVEARFLLEDLEASLAR